MPMSIPPPNAVHGVKAFQSIVIEITPPNI
ncbi:protein of unknown function [Candidatus Nitrosacidococcus tergens]|uniref:Uncharacterized protein n=1 Tax=Candidatus Nitrosacidococcus tergens TaxID=553981 RepID=A0A7G1Q9E7_9GAMM|nr:protein of unknown function [Candidatus Nitrosacidococcus tergens]